MSWLKNNMAIVLVGLALAVAWLCIFVVVFLAMSMAQ